MSFASMQGKSMFIGSSIGEGQLVFSDGSVQTTAYTGTSDTSGNVNATNLTVSGTSTLGSSTEESQSTLTIYGRAQQLLSDSDSTQFGANCLANITTGSANTSFGTNSQALTSSGSQNSSFGNYSLNSNTTGSDNTSMGYNAMLSNTSAIRN
jgi:hypothetical protein